MDFTQKRMNLIENMIKIYQKLVNFHQNQALIVIDYKILSTDFELDQIQMTKLLESEFEMLMTRFIGPNCLVLTEIGL